MFNRKKISHSVDQKSKNNNKKIKDLATWINNYEIQAYATEEMKEEIKDLVLEVYNYDKDIRDYFFKKYISVFSDILNLKSNPREIDCIFKEDISYDIPEKSEFKLYIENRNNKILEQENSKKKNYNCDNYWSEDKKFKNKTLDDDDNNDDLNKYDYKNKKRNKDKKTYLSEQKRNNSKIRNYEKNRYKMINKYNNIYGDININNIKVNKINENNSKEKDINEKKDIYYAYKNPSMINFRGKKIKKNNNEEKNDNKNSNEYTNIPRLLLINHYKKNDNDKREIKIYSLKNMIPNNEKEIKTFNNKIFNNRYNTDNNSEINIEKELYMDSNFNNIKNLKKETLKNIYNTYEKNDDSLHKFEDEYSEENENEIKKINISGVNYRISGLGPKKVEIDKQIIYDKNLNKKENEDDPNKKTNLSHKIINIRKNIDEDNIVQNIEKDEKISKTLIRNINIPKDSYINKEREKNLKEIFNYNGKDINNNNYEISIVKEDQIFGIDPYIFSSELHKKYENNSNIKVNKNISYNERRKRKLANKVYSSDKKRVFNYNNYNYNKENKNIENNGNIKTNINNNINEIKEQDKEIRSNWRDYKYKNNTFNTNVNRSNGMNNEEVIKEKRINYIERKNVDEYNNKKVNNINEIKSNDYKEINGSEKRDSFNNKRKRFHRVIKSGI